MIYGPRFNGLVIPTGMACRFPEKIVVAQSRRKLVLVAVCESEIEVVKVTEVYRGKLKLLRRGGICQCNQESTCPLFHGWFGVYA